MKINRERKANTKLESSKRGENQNRLECPYGSSFEKREKG